MNRAFPADAWDVLAGMLVRPSSTLRALASGHGPQPAALGLAVPMAVATLANLAGAGTRLGTLGSLTPPWE
ncbi:MAG: hypothetical protein IRY95_09595, partial [Clostridia bacterium]|nr:hypothetical protein [Clostridia bacterium]